MPWVSDPMGSRPATVSPVTERQGAPPMSWQVEVAIVVVILVLSLGVTAYVVGLGGSGRRTRKVREQLEAMTGSTVTVVIGTLEDQELRSLSRVRGKVVEV